MTPPKPNRMYLPLIQGVNRLFVSGLYGIIAGTALGGVVGCAIGTINPFFGNIAGLFLGGLAGAVIGFPTGIIGAGLKEKAGWRLAGGFSTLTVGLCLLWACHLPTVPAWTALLFAACVHIGFWAGGQAHDRIERGMGFYARWKAVLHFGPHRLRAETCLPSLLIVLVPVATLYVVLFSLLSSALAPAP